MIKAGEENLRVFPQSVKFSGQDDENSVELVSKNVTIIPSAGGNDHGSSKVKFKSIVDFAWEFQFYAGQLLAVHMSGKYLAYGIKAGSGAGVVRVVYKEREQRALLRGMRGTIQDLAFARVSGAVLACIDYLGCLFVHTIDSTPTNLVCTLILQVETEEVSPTIHRVIWCPYIPEDEVSEGDDVSKFLLVTRGSKAELWSVDNVSSVLGPEPIKLTDPLVSNCGGMTEICQHSGAIVEAILSPDGTAIATASLDGEIKFFQVIIHGNAFQQPSCLHEWRPHEGRPISSMFFLDDHKNYQPDAQFWRFAITGCDNNSELKVWSCEKWVCLQTIRFDPSPISGKIPVLKAGLDLSASFLLLSDICNKGLYILYLSKDSDDGIACVSTISEFLLPYPILSFGIVDAGLRKVRPTGESLEDLCPCEDENEDQFVIRMYLVQPKSLQECHIAFRPIHQMANNCLMDTLTHDSLDYNEDLQQHIRHDDQNGIAVENGEEEEEERSVTIEGATNVNGALNLMTPDAFSSPAKKENSESNRASPELGTVLSASPSLAQAVQALNATEPPLATSELEQAPPSGGSSTSREVREILFLAGLEEEGKEEEVLDWSDIPIVSLMDVGARALQDFVFPEDEAKKETPRAELKGEEWSEVPRENWTEVPYAWRRDHPPASKSGRESEEFPEKEGKTNAPGSIAKEENDAADIIANEEDEEDDEVEVPETRVVPDHNIAQLSQKLESILETMQEQRQELRELRAEVTRLRQDTPIATRVESALARASQQQLASMEQTLYARIARQNDFLDELQTNITNKIETALPQVVSDVVEPLKAHLRTDVSRIDALVRDNLTQLIGGPHIRDTVALAATNAAKPALENAFKEAFANVLLSRMEKACQSMFRQVQDAFARGTHEYLQNVETLLDKQCQQRNEQQNEASLQLLTSTSNLVREDLRNEMMKTFATFQDETVRNIRECVRDNLNQQLIDIAGARSRATTPCISVPAVADTQSRVLSLIQRGQLNAAFQQALSASDLGLVVLVCEKTEPARVFSSSVGPQGQGQRCLLQQPVILSLVQQLSADLGHRTELKHRWLEEAILNLDTNDPVTREHMGTVLLTLQSQLAAFVAANPNHRSTKRMKMLGMAARALLNPHP
ncbi:enhancer of mRNA-decapping protein 4 [Venturia canescens]|uniref:enhancer of mRNA-decapping protein 4 n=1 Tax=Venturia canescens TaxID=32260 RepID=UPI001C9CC633|nr:enhancer of mRNA-decapping protein 4 [Venturia canescens]XP_043285481.1 enhancer of mRNA-decapping protein 4 [Venturia canescens]